MLCRMRLQSHSAQRAKHTPFHDMLPHNRIINNDVISQNFFNINIILTRFSAGSLMMVEVETFRSDIYVYFNVNFNVFIKLKKK